MKLYCFALVVFGIFLAVRCQGNTSRMCKYEFLVPQGLCNNQVVDQQINEVKADIDRDRLHNIAKNSILQNTIMQVQSDSNKYMTKIHDLQRELMTVKQTVTQLPVGIGNGSNQNMSQIAKGLNDILTKSIAGVYAKIANITSEFARLSMEKSKTNEALELQIKQRNKMIEDMAKRVNTVKNQVKNIPNSATTGVIVPQVNATGGLPLSNVTYTQLQQMYVSMQKDAIKLDIKLQNQDKIMNQTTNDLVQKYNNITNEAQGVLNLLNVSTNAHIQSVDQLAQQVLTDFLTFNSSVGANMSIWRKDLSDVHTTIADVIANETREGKLVVSLRGDVASNKLFLQNLNSTIRPLQPKISDLSLNVSNEIANLTQDQVVFTNLKQIFNMQSNSNVSLPLLYKIFGRYQSMTQQELTKDSQDLMALNMMINAVNTTFYSKHPSG